MDEYDKMTAVGISGKDQAMAFVRDHAEAIDAYARFFPDEIVRVLACMILCEYKMYNRTTIENGEEDGS